MDHPRIWKRRMRKVEACSHLTTTWPILDGDIDKLVEGGATSQQFMAIYGWSKLEMAERYTRKVDRSRLSGTLSEGFGLEDEEG